MQLPLGTEVVFLNWGKNGFYMVEYNGQSGYASSDYLGLIDAKQEREVISAPTPSVDIDVPTAINKMMPALKVSAYMAPAMGSNIAGWSKDAFWSIFICYSMWEDGIPHLIDGKAVFNEKEKKEILTVLDPGYDGLIPERPSYITIDNGTYFIPLAQPEDFRLKNPEYTENTDGSVDVTFDYSYYEGSSDATYGIVSMHLVPNTTLDESRVLNLPFLITFVESGSASNNTISDGYIIMGNNSRYISDEELNAYSPQQLCYARNEIYAHHGRMFKSIELQQYFGTKDWYQPLYDWDYFDHNLKTYLNDYEIKNGDKILAYEEAHGRYQLDQPGYNIYAVD